MAGALTDVEFANRALARIGLSPAVSFLEDDGDYEAQVGRLYESVTEALLGWSDWSFNRKTAVLNRLTSPGEIPNKWDYAHQLPPDRIGKPDTAYAGTAERRFTEFELEGDRLYSNETDVKIQYAYKPEPADWPAHFRRVAETALAAQFAASIAENFTLQDRLYAQAFGSPSEGGHGGEMGMAEMMEAHGQPSEDMDETGGVLLTSRF